MPTEPEAQRGTFFHPPNCVFGKSAASVIGMELTCRDSNMSLHQRELNSRENDLYDGSLYFDRVARTFANISSLPAQFSFLRGVTFGSKKNESPVQRLLHDDAKRDSLSSLRAV